ncbi:MAG: methyltransferase [Pedobacter sp.]|nr:methyltransferase [Chitinophagaceae bacterium]
MKPFAIKLSLLLLIIITKSSAQTINYTIDKLLFKDDFSTVLDTTKWAVEKLPDNNEKVFCSNGKLVLDTYGGATVWYKKELYGNILISFKRKVIMQGGNNDRLSDFNQFWMATDTIKNQLFKRKATFNEYDSLSMYYVGFGGNYNTTTRFRKYNTLGEKKILGEFTNAQHLLQSNKEYTIKIIILNGVTQFLVNDELYFSYKDDSPLTHGYFAFRSTRSHQEIDEVSIYSLR